uniref:CbiX protein n=1 Tax=Candidatus Kentrum sp. UNK TaxID=2126344 RepID=A0A451AXI4_9GAMM|nr:MAG: CbiX protein [Candidatus Kentron sp. UNK]VFK70743.1 MAG: CbiX protein [Candidatus Kentron sp. UNK]
MKDIILLIGHGSRGPDGNREIERFAGEWRARQPGLDIEVCFIEFADVLLEEGLDCAVRCATVRGAKRVIVVPLILNPPVT